MEKICIDRGLTDESEILRFLQHGTLVGLLPVPHPILIRKYQPNPGTAMWFRTYMWGVIYRKDNPFNIAQKLKLFNFLYLFFQYGILTHLFGTIRTLNCLRFNVFEN